jgi:Domain of unknown function (DUF4210)/Chromosome segregation during meiosis
MPIFQDDLDRGQATPPRKPEFPFRCPPTAEAMRRKASEESIRTELCEGPIPDSPSYGASPQNVAKVESVRDASRGVSNRVELIERLKRGESPTWVPTRHVSGRIFGIDIIPFYLRCLVLIPFCLQLESILPVYDSKTLSSKSVTDTTRSPPLLPAADIRESLRTPPSNGNETLQAGLSIERPGSALHTGDFTQEGPEREKESTEQRDIDSRRIPLHLQSSWLASSPPRDFSPFQHDSRLPFAFRSILDPHTRSRAPSLSSSFSSSFVFKPPTSPLVQSETNDDLESSSTMNPIDITPEGPRSHRHHTHQASNSVHSTPSTIITSPFDRSLSHLRRDNPYPYQAHQPRRSMTVINQNLSQSESSPPTPILHRPRRPSASESSPLQLAPMVGSYEESILRGRMSTTPSRPLDFVAQIGVLGLGKCKSNLRCPAHVTLPFPAVFYSYGTTTHGRTGKSEDGPSPYVGQIDLENGLPNPDEMSHDSRRRRLNRTPERKTTRDFDMMEPPEVPFLSERDIRRAQKQKRRSTSPRAPPGGSYRIPEKGQLQIIIKNPNKTAVKLFLVPYDLTGMEPGTKTFIRQRSYSTGPTIDSAILSSPQARALDSPKDRPTLRYLIHLHICSPSKGRFYLYKTIRVVFANRVPDGKEKLHNEVQFPEPRFSVYKPGRESAQSFAHGSLAGANLAAEKAFRRRSSGYALSPLYRTLDGMDGIAQSLQASVASGAPFPHVSDFGVTPVEPIPFSLFRRKAPLADGEGTTQLQSPASSKSSRPPTSQDNGMSMSASTSSWMSNNSSSIGYDKLSKGDVGYGGNAYTGLHIGSQVAADGLLAIKLKGLGVGKLGQESPTSSI